jgi:hypothetical protein
MRGNKETTMDLSKLTDDERLIAEQAVAMARAVKLAGDQAPHGKGLFCLEQAVLDRGKELMRTVLQKTISVHPEAQKRG